MNVAFLDRLLIGALATGIWLATGLLFIGHSPASADTEYGFVTKFDIYNIDGLDRYIIATIEGCIIDEQHRITCGDMIADERQD